MTPRLRAEKLADLTTEELAGMAGASRPSFTIDTYPTWICTPLATAIVTATQRALSLRDCPP